MGLWGMRFWGLWQEECGQWENGENGGIRTPVSLGMRVYFRQYNHW